MHTHRWLVPESVAHALASLTYQPVGTVVMKNWEPLVLGPALAMLSRNGTLCST